MIGTIDVAVEAKSPNLPLFPMRAFVGSPSSIRVRNVPKRVGDWNISRVYLTVVYPDGTIKQADCVQTGGVWVGTVGGTQLEGVSENGYTVFADGTDENGNAVSGYVLGKGDVVVLDANGTLNPGSRRDYVRVLSAEAQTPVEGDLWRGEDGVWYIWQGGEAWPIDDESGAVGELSAEMSAKADLSALGDYVPFTVDKNGSKTAVTVGTRAISSSVGQYSFACGVSNTAGNLNTVALGYSNVATGQDAVAIGSTNTAAGSTSLAVGSTNTVLTAYSIALGQNNTLSGGSNTTAIGTMNTANGKYGVAMGGRANADDSGSFVWNGGDKASVFLFPLYHSHGKGTFNINPVSGAAGFYIGEESLTDILSAKADLSAVQMKRDWLDNKVYVDPLADVSATTFTVAVAFSGSPDQPLFTIQLTHTGGEDVQWAWAAGGQRCNISYYGGQYTLSYYDFQDGGGNLHSGSMTIPLAAPFWTGSTEDQYFNFSATSQKTVLATQEWVLAQLAALEARLAGS